MEKKTRAFRGIWIPSEIWLCNELNIQEKLFLVEIDSLDNEEGCYASNKYFSEFFNISKGRVSQIINELERKKWLTINYIYDKKNIEKRVIKIVSPPFPKVFNKLNRGYLENDKGVVNFLKGGYLENDKDNNTNNNNTNNNNTNNNIKEETKKKYGEFDNVLLTDIELDKLKDRYSDYDKKIENLSLYIESKGSKYKSHYATILSWANKETKKQISSGIELL